MKKAAAVLAPGILMALSLAFPHAQKPRPSAPETATSRAARSASWERHVRMAAESTFRNSSLGVHPTKFEPTCGG